MKMVKIKEDKNWTCAILLEMFEFVYVILSEF